MRKRYFTKVRHNFPDVCFSFEYVFVCIVVISRRYPHIKRIITTGFSSAATLMCHPASTRYYNQTRHFMQTPIRHLGVLSINA